MIKCLICMVIGAILTILIWCPGHKHKRTKISITNSTNSVIIVSWPDGFEYDPDIVISSINSSNMINGELVVD